MSKISFSISWKQKNGRVKKPSRPPPPSDSSNKNYITEFIPGEKPEPEPEAKRIPPVPDQLRYNKRLKNLPNIPQTGDASLQFELYGGSNTDGSDGSMSFGFNFRQTTGATKNTEDLQLRMLREDLRILPDAMAMEEFNEMPVEEFSVALLRGYGWKEGKGIGRNPKEDVKVDEVAKKIGRGGLWFCGNDDNIGVQRKRKTVIVSAIACAMRKR